MDSKKATVSAFVAKLFGVTCDIAQDDPGLPAFGLSNPSSNGALIGEELARSVSNGSFYYINAFETRIETVMAQVRHILYDHRGEKVPSSWFQWVERMVTRALEVALGVLNGCCNHAFVQACMQLVSGFGPYFDEPFTDQYEALWYLLGRSSGGLRRRRDTSKLTWFQMLLLAALENATEKKSFESMRLCVQANPEIGNEFSQILKSDTVPKKIKSHVRSFLWPKKDVSFLEHGDRSVSYKDIIAMFGNEATISEGTPLLTSPVSSKQGGFREEPPDTYQATRLRSQSSPELNGPKRARIEYECTLPNIHKEDGTIDMDLWNLLCHENPQVALGDVKRVSFPWLPPNPPVRTQGKPLTPPRVWNIAQQVNICSKWTVPFVVDSSDIATIDIPN